LANERRNFPSENLQIEGTDSRGHGHDFSSLFWTLFNYALETDNYLQTDGIDSMRFATNMLDTKPAVGPTARYRLAIGSLSARYRLARGRVDFHPGSETVKA
jgi:hypothetical protein